MRLVGKVDVLSGEESRRQYVRRVEKRNAPLLAEPSHQRVLREPVAQHESDVRRAGVVGQVELERSRQRRTRQLPGEPRQIDLTLKGQEHDDELGADAAR